MANTDATQPNASGTSALANAAIDAAKKARPKPRDPVDVERSILTLAAARAEALTIDGPTFLARVTSIASMRAAFVSDAASEPSADRFAMLVAAAAEAHVLLDMTVEQIASAVRALRDLGVSDARELLNIAGTSDSGGLRYQLERDRYDDAETHAHGLARRYAWQASPSRDLLAVTHMVVRPTNYELDRAPINITDRGAIVLDVLRAWSV